MYVWTEKAELKLTFFTTKHYVKDAKSGKEINVLSNGIKCRSPDLGLHQGSMSTVFAKHLLLIHINSTDKSIELIWQLFLLGAEGQILIVRSEWDYLQLWLSIANRRDSEKDGRGKKVSISGRNSRSTFSLSNRERWEQEAFPTLQDLFTCMHSLGSASRELCEPFLDAHKGWKLLSIREYSLSK